LGESQTRNIKISQRSFILCRLKTPQNQFCVYLNTHIKTEKFKYKAFQRLFGSSVGLRAPGMFVELLKRKAENAGGKVEEVSTYKTKLSQACYCGKFVKKPLSQRWDKCSCGIVAQRDLYSA
jgi:hypothetical protein